MPQHIFIFPPYFFKKIISTLFKLFNFTFWNGTNFTKIETCIVIVEHISRIIKHRRIANWIPEFSFHFYSYCAFDIFCIELNIGHYYYYPILSFILSNISFILLCKNCKKTLPIFNSLKFNKKAIHLFSMQKSYKIANLRIKN